MEGDSPVAHTIKEKNDQSRNELKFPNATSPSEFIPSTSQGLGIWRIRSGRELIST